MGQKSREKGKAGEREAAAEIGRLFQVAARRGQQFCGGPGSPDIVCDLPGVHFEVKRAEKQRLYDWLAQAADECGGSVPVVLHRQNSRPWLAVVKLDDLPQLAGRLTDAMSRRQAETETTATETNDGSTF